MFSDSYLATLSVLSINVDTTFSSSFPFIFSSIFDTSVGYTFSFTTFIFNPKLFDGVNDHEDNRKNKKAPASAEAGKHRALY